MTPTEVAQIIRDAASDLANYADTMDAMPNEIAGAAFGRILTALEILELRAAQPQEDAGE